jgi:uroporphyrinogen-III synthase
MKVLITRPSIYTTPAQPNCIYLPLLKYLTCTSGSQLHSMHSIASYDIIIFISRFAVSSVMPHIQYFTNLYQPQYIAIGKATAAALQLYNIKAQYAKLNSCSESLLSLTVLQHIKDKKILIFSSYKGRTKLQDTLNTRGAITTVIPAYKTAIVHYSLPELCTRLDRHVIKYLTATSKKILMALMQIIQVYNQSWYHLPLIVPSKRLLTAAQNLGFNQVILSKSASIKDMIECSQSMSANTNL